MAASVRLDCHKLASRHYSKLLARTLTSAVNRPQGVPASLGKVRYERSRISRRKTEVYPQI
jgi:hypothetical protein